MNRNSWKYTFLLAAFFAASASAQWIPNNPVTAVHKESDGVLFTLQKGSLKVQLCTDSLVHIVYAPSWPPAKKPGYVVVKHNWPSFPWHMQENEHAVTLSTGKLTVRVAREDGQITYKDANGRTLLNEGPKQMTPAVVNHEHTYHSEDVFKIYGSEEGLYGLGQHQAGVWNYRGEDVPLSQANTNIAIPVFLSSKGYGVFWNNTSVSRFNNRFVHYLFLTSQVADSIDYYFLYGPKFDKMIAEYRELTGAAPMFGKWAYGYWQSKNRYSSQAQVLQIAKKYRELGIPIDNIVQDWFWWTTMGSFKFNSNYPNPKQMVQDLHNEHFHLMISVWPFFDPGTAVYQEMQKRGYFIAKTLVKGFHPKGSALYDASNPAARKFYWQLMDRNLFKIGVDAWWLDTDEPETEGRQENLMTENKIHIGNGAKYANIYPLLTSMGVYKNQRKATSQKRVFILSRSAFAGSQRFGVTAWSGDILSDWLSFRRQIPAGLNYEVSGLPYWTTDIGGFILGHPNNPSYRELFVRWFEYGSFCPIFRVHGTRSPNVNELWSYGPQAESILTKFDRLRYRLLPYIYSMAWMVTSQNYTPMRPLVMDFRKDVKAQNIGNQFMFGPAILVNPVTEPGARSRRLYLPNALWYDFWSGQKHQGPAEVDAPAPLGRIPLYVRAGSILPMGPEMQWSTQKPDNPIELRVYPGADGDFTLYEDDGKTYDYENGQYTTIPFHWDDAGKTLTIGDRKGQFPGMLKNRTFRVVFVGSGHGTGVNPTYLPDKIVHYNGAAITIEQEH